MCQWKRGNSSGSEKRLWEAAQFWAGAIMVQNSAGVDTYSEASLHGYGSLRATQSSVNSWRLPRFGPTPGGRTMR